MRYEGERENSQAWCEVQQLTIWYCDTPRDREDVAKIDPKHSYMTKRPAYKTFSKKKYFFMKKIVIIKQKDIAFNESEHVDKHLRV